MSRTSTIAVRISLALALALATVAASTAAPGGRERPRVFAFTESPSAEAVFSTSAAVPLRFTLRNDSERDVKVLVWHTPIEGFSADIFDVQRDGEPVPYVGRLVKRAAPRETDYVAIAAGVVPERGIRSLRGIRRVAARRLHDPVPGGSARR